MVLRAFVAAVCAIVLFMATAGLAQAQAVQVKGARIRFDTTNDDREGGIVKVELWADQSVVYSHSFTEKPEWKKNSRHEVTVPVNRILPLDKLVTRVTLTDGREVNISWTFHTEIELRGPGGNSLRQFYRKDNKLDTTGPGRRSSHVDIQRTK